MAHDIITPAQIGEYISLDQCSRFFKHHIDEIEHSENHSADEYVEAFTPLNLLLSEIGNEFEQAIKSDLAVGASELRELTTEADPGDDEFDPDHELILSKIQEGISAAPSTEPVVLFQPTLSGTIGTWHIGGHADFVFLWPTETGVEVRVIDAKSSSDEKSYQQIQAAVYTNLIEQIVADDPRTDDDAVSYSSGVITRESDYQPVTPTTVPSFDYDSRIADITRQLGPGADIETTADYDLETAPHQLNSKCNQCPYNESCTTEAFEASHVRLLGLSDSEQETLEAHDITTIDELADPCAEPRDSEEQTEWKPTEQKRASFVAPESAYHDLKSQPGIGERLPNLVYRAQALQKQLAAPETHQSALWLPGTGRCQLPEDDPYDPADVSFEPNSLIRVYLNVQEDHLRDRVIQLNARVSVGDPDISSRRISELSDAAPGDPDDAAREEKELLESFIESLNTAIESIGTAIELDGETNQQHPLLQFYTYTGGEEDTLRDALNRHSSDRIAAFTDTFEGPASIDTPRVCHLKPEIRTRLAIPTPSYGLLHVYDAVQPPGDSYSKPRRTDGWEYTPPHASTDDSIDIRKLFRRRLFNTEVAWSRDGESISVSPSEYPDAYGLKTRYRYGAEIPLGYFWAAIGRIDDQWMADLETDIESSPRIQHDINGYRYHNAESKETPIAPPDLTALGKHLVDVLEHVERALIYRSERITERKPEFDPSTVWTDTHSTATVAEAARDYLSIEHTTQQREHYELYRKLPRQRILSGESLPVKITSIDADAGGDLSIVVTGKLPYDHPNLFDENSDAAKLVCKRKGKENTSSGDWMVANRYQPTQVSEAISKPYEIERGVQATIRDIDLKADEIVFELRNMYWEPGNFDCNHRNYTLNESEAIGDDWLTYVERNEWLILDPATTSFSADRADKALETAEQNELHTLLEKLRWGEDDALCETLFDSEQLEAFASWLSANVNVDSFPNDRQQEFITTANQVGLLQGPPGTGKTAGTLAPALCARLFAAGQGGRSVAGLITGPSNTAIDELLADTAELVETLCEAGVNGFSADTIELVRITREPPTNPADGVSYLHYSNDDDTEALNDLYERIIASGEGVIPPGMTSSSSTDGGGATQTGQATFTTFDTTDATTTVVGDGPPASEQTHTLVFTTPTSSWGLLKDFASSGADPVDIASQSLWDLVVGDEASMLTLPKLVLAGAGMKSSAQLLLGGDHRQLPPVQKYEWEDERRRSVTEAAPHLSTLDYFRLLGGDPGASAEILDSEQRELLAADIDADANSIPLVQLNTTFRFGPDTADFIGKTVYAKDGIDYSATAHDSVPQLHTADTEPLQAVYDPASITVITYDAEQTYQQVNPIEAAITNLLLWNHSHDATAGVVTPHNAQRTRVRENLYNLQQRGSDTPINLDNGTQVETVNRFQGGQKDIMVVSATASNPQFIRSESDFLLELNRANVAFSRHQYKLIVVMAESLLSHIPEEPDTYDDALLWKTLSQSAGEAPTTDGEPYWAGTLTEFMAPVDPADPQRAAATAVSVYHLY